MRPRRIVIQRLGRVRPELLTGLRRSLRDLYGLTVSIAPTVRRLTPDAYSSSRDQYRADLLLRHVQENVADGEAVAAITEADISFRTASLAKGARGAALQETGRGANESVPKPRIECLAVP